MTKISRLPLRKDVWERVFKLFTETIAETKDKKVAEEFIYDFFSPTERIMFSKRLAAALLIAKGHSYQSIRSVLKISPTTLAKISTKVKFDGEGLNIVIENILRRQESEIFWKGLESLIDTPSKGTLRSPSRLKRKYDLQREVESLKNTF